MTLRTTSRWVDKLVDITALRFIVWVMVVVATYPGFLQNPFHLADWFDDHLLYAWEDVDRFTLLDFGQLPQWNPYWCGGTAGIAEPEDSFYSPDFLLRLMLGTEHGRRMAILVLFTVGMEGTYRLCRRFDTSAVASGFAALAFHTCDRFVSFIHDGWVHFMSFHLISWVLLGLVNGIESPRWRIAGGFFMAWIVLAPGTYASPYTAIAFAYLFVAIVILRFARRERSPLKGPVISAATLGLAAFLFACCKLVPTVLYMREFPRVFTPTEVHGITELFGQLTPKYDVVLFLAIVGVVVGDVATGIWIGGTVLFFFLSMGEYGPTAPFHLVKKLPVLGALRYPDRFMLITIYFLVLAAARGLTRIEDFLPAATRTIWRALRRVPRLRSHFDSLDPPRPLQWLLVGLVAFGLFRAGRPYVEALTAPQRGRSALFVEPPPRPFAGEFKQFRGNRRDAHLFPAMNLGSINCVAGIPLPQSSALRGDLEQEEYPADPALAKVTRASWSPNVIELDVDAKAATRVIVNQNWDRKWRTSVGSVVSDRGLLAVDVPAGQYRLKLAYRDPIIYLSLLVTLGALFGCAFLGGRQLYRATRREIALYRGLPLLPGGAVPSPPPPPPEEPKPEPEPEPEEPKEP